MLRGRLEAALATLVATHGAVELEWAATGDVPVFLQLRPYRAGRPRRAAANTGAAEPGWRWDAAHNPLPLSPAQAGLVALVDARCAVPFAQQVRGGYLFYRPREVAPAANHNTRSPPRRAFNPPPRWHSSRRSRIGVCRRPSRWSKRWRPS